MRRQVYQVIFIFVAFVLAGGLMVGCGGGGGGDGQPSPSPTPPPAPPPVGIGPGPGPAADAIPAGETISTVAARGAPFATAPREERARQAAIERIEDFAGNLPQTEDDLRDLLADFTDWVAEQPDDAVAQAGLAAAIVLAGAYNAGIDAGYTTSQILSLLDPVSEIASAAVPGDPVSTAATAVMLTAASFPTPTDPDFSSADLQIGVRKFLLPALVHARERLDAVADGAPGPDTRLAEIPSRRSAHAVYRSDVRAASGTLRIGQALLLAACAYQFNPGDWDWTEPLADRDADGDGRLSVAEYLPPDPFMWRHRSNNMQLTGQHLRGALDTLIAAVAEAHDDSLIAQVARPDGTATALAKLRDLREMVGGEVDVRIDHEGGLEDPGDFSTRMNLSRLWEAPVDDLKTLFPTMRPVNGGHWEALPDAASDFPQPTLGGVFPRPEPVLEMLTTGPTYIAISHGSVERMTVIDRRSAQ